MINNILSPVKFTKTAFDKLTELISYENNPDLKFRIYITGGGCSGFQYGFILDVKTNKDDIIIKNKNISLVIDLISLQYITGSILDYIEDLKGSRFTIINPNAKITCSCGSSFSIY